MLEQGELTHEIIGAAFEVHRVLGYGFLEKVYQRAMQVELIKRGLEAELEYKITVYYNVLSALRSDYFSAICQHRIFILNGAQA